MGRDKNHIVTEETKIKISNSLKGRHISPNTEFKKGYSEDNNVGKSGRSIKEWWDKNKHSEKVKIRNMKIREYQLGKKVSLETREKLRLFNLGKILSEETKKKIGISNKGKLHSKETKELLSKKHIGIKHTEETKNKIKITRIERLRSGKIIPPMLGRTGKLSHSWLGGKSFEPYTSDFNRSFKKLIRQRDNFICLKCGIFEDDAKILYKRKLAIHHIDYNKENTFMENCCSLCMRCNAEVNRNREQWKTFFQSILSEKYGYKYDINKNIIIDFGGQY